MNFKAICSIVSMTLLIASCATVPYTNRKKLNLVNEAEVDQQSAAAYAEVKKTTKMSTDAATAEIIKRVGHRIAAVAEKPDYKWEFILIDDPKTPNAWCLPGGRVAFYTGILPMTQDETGIAVVMSHEVAHALAGHGAERMSQGVLVGGLQQFAVAAGLVKTEGQLKAAEMLYGLGIGLPHGRKQESEADRIGLILMAKAGYDPRLAIPFWERMSKASGGQKPPEFLSTHPSDSTRIKQIQQELPEALKYYKP